MPHGNFANDTGMAQDVPGIELGLKPTAPSPQVVDPNGGVGEDHSAGNRRRGGATRSGEQPPRRANRRAASRSISAFSASRTMAAVSFRPVYERALASNSSSRAIVVRMVPAPHRHQNMASDDAVFNASRRKTRHQPDGIAAVDRLAFGLGQRVFGEQADILFERVVGVVAAEQ